MADNIDTAPKGANAGLHEIQKRLGFIPNLVSGLAHAPTALDGYLALDRAWNHSSFTAEERQIVLLAASVENSCRYCAALHATMLKAMRTAPATISAIRNRVALQELKRNALVKITRDIVAGRGFASEGAKRDFLAAGYNAIALKELTLGIALATMGNYLDHLDPTQIDPALANEAR
jgi:AhpD family alkylhydroperoxidase